MGARTSPDPWVQVSLNPQPLPPRTAFAVALAQGIADQVSLLAGLAGAATGGSDTEAAASELLTRFVDDCGNGRIHFPWKHWPFPWPHQGDDLVGELNPAEIVVVGVELANAAAWVDDERLRRDLEQAGANLVDAGLGRM